jgi:hypothetical protein
LFSARNITKHVSRCAGYEFEDVICACDDVDMVAPVCTHPYRESRRLKRFLMEQLGNGERILHSEPPADRTYDLFFAFLLRPWDLRYLSGLRGLLKRCRKAACVISEVWPSQIQSMGEHGDVLKDFDCIFTNMESTIDAIAEYSGRPCRYLAHGVDAIRFSPLPDNPMRSIDVYSIGRRVEEEHRVLKAGADRGELFYVYDTVRNFDVTDPCDHRALVAGLIKRSRYFIAYPAKFGLEEETGGHQELGPRYFEGSAGGAVMIGRAPGSPGFANCFDWPDAVIPSSPDPTQIASLVAELDTQPERMQHIRRINVVNSLRRHDWGYRWRDVLECFQLPARSALIEREEQLNRLACLAEAGAALSMPDPTPHRHGQASV